MCLSCTVSVKAAPISQNFKRSRDLKCTPMLQNFNMCNTTTLYVKPAQTKFEISSFIRSKDMAWAPKWKNESRDSDHAHLGDNQALQD